jgi:hypothetical protein
MQRYSFGFLALTVLCAPMIVARAQDKTEAAAPVDPKKPAEEAKREAERQKAEELRLAREAKQKAEAEEAAARAAMKVITDRGDACLKVKLSRTPDDVFRAVAKVSKGADKDLPDEEKFLLYVQAGEWEKFRDLIAAYPSDFPARMHNKVLSDLMWANPKPVFLPTDVLRLADASPTEPNDKQTLGLGKLLGIAVAKGESHTELMKQLQQGTKRLGGDDPAKRHAAARVLAAAEFWNEAKEFGLKESEIPELAAALKPGAETKLAEPDWEPLLATARDSSRTAEEREAALSGLHLAMLQSTLETVKNRLSSVLADNAQQEMGWELISLIGRKTARGQADFDFNIRRVNLELQEVALQLLARHKRLNDAPGPTLANLYARNWHAEGVQTLTVFPAWKKAAPDAREKYQHVSIEELLRTAPSDEWLAALEPQLASSVKLMVARLTLLSDNIDRLVPMLAEFSRRDKTAAAELGGAYLLRWTQLHDPSFTPEAIKQYKLDGHAIVLTRAEQEQSLKQLGAMLKSLDPQTRKLLNEAMLVTAFDLCHSKAEIYTRDQVQVFGPLDALPPTLLLSLLERMRFKLGAHWRNLAVQTDAATKRDSDDVFELVNEGYSQADAIATEWLAAHPDDWRTTCTAGSILAEWAEFAYFQAVASNAGGDRFATYLKRSSAALDRFRAGAKAYAEAVPKLSRAEFSLLPYRSWFYGLLGIAHDSDVNLRKGVTHDSLVEISQAMKSLPKGAGGIHLRMFSTMVADNVKANVIAPQMKYRYLSSAVQITGRNATVYPAEEKLQYYESLLREIRLRARVDGSPKIRQNGEFGVFVTLVHTADLAREAGGFGKYLQNETRRTVSGKTVVEQPLYRDRFEEALRLALADFFEIKSIIFADPNAGSQPMITEGREVSVATTSAPVSVTTESTKEKWQETPLAYLHLVAKDATVDRVPPLEIELDFFDRDGKVVIPLPSTPVLIEIAGDAPARRTATDIAITEIVDARELAEHKRLKLDVIATANGMVPDLEDLLDLQGFGLKVTNVDNREGVHVSELHSGDDGLYAKSERNWTVELDPSPLLQGATTKVEFRFPQPKSEAIAVTYRTYKDMDPVEAAAQVTLVEGKDAAAIAEPNYIAWIGGGIVALLAIGFLLALLWKKPAGADAIAPAFVAPREASPFAVASLLHRIRTSPAAKLTETQRAELEREINSLESASFAPEAKPRSESELQSLAERWVRTALQSGAASSAA